MSNFTAILIIAVFIYLVTRICESCVVRDIKKYLPAICSALGGVVGALCFILVPGLFPADNLVAAILTGVVCGFGATGAHKITKKTDDSENKEG